MPSPTAPKSSGLTQAPSIIEKVALVKAMIFLKM
jgi:hypothetical protein